MLWLPPTYAATKNALATTALHYQQECSGYHCPTLHKDGYGLHFYQECAGYHCPTLLPRMCWLPLSYTTIKNAMATTALHSQECAVYHCPTLPPRLIWLPLPYTVTKMAKATTILQCHQDGSGYHCHTLHQEYSGYTALHYHH